MVITDYSSTEEVMRELASRIRDTRVDMAVTQKELSEMANCSLRTITNLEAGRDVSFATVIDVLRALNLLQNMDLVIPAGDTRPMIILERQNAGAAARRRVSKRKRVSEDTWKWGDEK